MGGWGGKGPDRYNLDTDRLEATDYYSFDCSGLHTWADFAAGGPDRRATWDTDKFWNSLAPAEVPYLGCYALYVGQGADVSHIMMVLGPGYRTEEGVEYMVLGASGGGSKTTSLEIAQAAAARVKIYRSHLYRADFRGFRLPLCTAERGLGIYSRRSSTWRTHSARRRRVPATRRASICITANIAPNTAHQPNPSPNLSATRPAQPAIAPVNKSDSARLAGVTATTPGVDSDDPVRHAFGRTERPGEIAQSPNRRLQPARPPEHHRALQSRRDGMAPAA